MAKQTILVEDCSPMVQYAPPGVWTDTPSTDSLAPLYSGHSYHITSQPNATASFQFHGVGFSVFGGRRPGYGPFSVFLDGREVFTGSPDASTSPVNNTLVSVSDLANDLHTVILANTGGNLMDIDFITFDTQIGRPGTNLSVTIHDDSDSQVNYLPIPSAWNTNSGPDFFNGTIHFTSSGDASALIQFTGDAFAVYGTVSPDHADISINIDGKGVILLGGSNTVSALRTQVLLYFAGDLGTGLHNVTMSGVQGINTGPFIDVDSFVVYAAQDSGQRSDTGNSSTAERGPNVINQPSTDTSGDAPSHESNNHKASIIGGTIGGIIALLFILIGLFLLWRKRQEGQKNPGSFKSNGFFYLNGFHKPKDISSRPNGLPIRSPLSPTTPMLPMQDIKEMGFAPVTYRTTKENPLPQRPPPVPPKDLNKRESQLSVAPSYYAKPEWERESDPLIRSIPPVPPLPPSSMSAGVQPGVTADTRPPVRPSRRPPTLKLNTIYSPV